ncbi:MAG TPA: helix-turn-helix domain-containing protein [Xanthobacteraceae bacterium]|nr:helix-turn-helix domain-containing protein [Xanthobacteraceae bacterium]
MRVRPLDTLLGFKALSLVSGLTENDRRVAATLLEHFNRKTGRCDPSLGRIARLLGINTRTVIRSIRHLEDAGLLRKHRHGGNLNRNQYEPIWLKLAELEAAWSARFKGFSAPTGRSPSPGQGCQLGGDSPVTQTYPINNLPQETCSGGHPSRSNATTPRSTFALPTTPPTTRSSTAMRSAAERRWNDQLLRRFASQPLTLGDIVKGIDSVMQEAATDAELARPGAGFHYIINALGVWTGRPDRHALHADRP